MKRSTIIAAALCLSLFLLNGCSEQEAEPLSQPPQEAVETAAPAPVAPPVQETPAAQPESPAAAPVHHIPTGVWLAQTDVGYSNYYYFNSEEQNGSYRSLDYGLGMDFNYEGSGDELVFFMGDDAEAQTAYIEHDEGDSFTLLWENNLPEKMQFVSEGTLEDFHFYSNDALTRLSAAHYTRTGHDPTSMAAAITNEDNTVTVQLYDNLGDHNSTSAWYVLDRFTATGTDLLTGMEIDLLEHLNPPTEEELPTEGEDPPAEGDAPAGEEQLPDGSEEEVPSETEEPTVDALPSGDADPEQTPAMEGEVQS